MNIQRHDNNYNEILISGATSAIEQMKYEIARELGVTLGPETSARANGSVGGEITKRLVRMGEEQLMGQYRLH
ncbi:spore protein [Bacillus cereus]|uniref:Alpha/beta-type small acid-soluble spore protein n=1 Tax=Bacillus arachidis TaxID=2819290 RepID=A0ABS3P2K4_9BACI|nr:MULTISPECIES: alpha/beta-type small acid-soluble spore protein [Bacillus]MBO1627432.1 alpha/beta-type small acid-soluble spore protein [Bacillus arachidis]PFD97132.1 spore protein [Bacillus sp. AFS023182]PGY02531.1 spore protein [Bacillus cereus]WIY63177.1 alpha/beta-type small acid-soluble spore protein [Bacillus arachidis]